MSLKFIMPDWDDFLDADFDFQNDSFSTENRTGRNEVYLYEMMGDNAPYDGLLVSLSQLTKKKGALKAFEQDKKNGRTIRDIMRIPPKLEIIGDCGAFSYKDEDVPTFTPEEAADHYHTFGFDVGVSVDHMIINEVIRKDDDGKLIKIELTEADMRRRIDITVDNAREFIRVVREKGYTFTPMASIQGMDTEDYVRVFREYIEMGYRQIAVGTLVPKRDEEILAIIRRLGEVYRELPEEIRKDVHMHLFGVLRPKILKHYKENGVSSFDSASYFRKAWLRSDKNYLAVDGQWYPALRVPQTALTKNKKALEANGISVEIASRMEERVLDLLNRYDRTPGLYQEVLDRLVEYDMLYERSHEDGGKIRDSYARVLTDRPWMNCTCPICREIGIHVMIFRGYNRNKRRGFHNTIVFYNALKNNDYQSVDVAAVQVPLAANAD